MGLLNTAAKDAPLPEEDLLQPPGNDFSPPFMEDDLIPAIEDVHRWIDAEDHPIGRILRDDYLDKFGVPPSWELIASAERQRRAT